MKALQIRAGPRSKQKVAHSIVWLQKIVNIIFNYQIFSLKILRPVIYKNILYVLPLHGILSKGSDNSSSLTKIYPNVQMIGKNKTVLDSLASTSFFEKQDWKSNEGSFCYFQLLTPAKRYRKRFLIEWHSHGGCRIFPHQVT